MSAVTAEPQRSRHDPWKTAFFVAAAVALVVGVAWALLGSSLFVVRSVKVSGAGTLPTSRVLAAAGIKIGTPLVRVDTAEAAQRIGEITRVQSARVHTSWPDTIVITTVLRTPTFVVRTGHDFAVLDSYGVILRRADSPRAGLVHLRSSQDKPVTAFRHDAAVLAAGAVVRDLPRWLRHRVSTVRVGGKSGVVLSLRHGLTVVWGDRTRAVAKAEEVGVLLRTHAKYVDVSDPGSATTGEPIAGQRRR